MNQGKNAIARLPLCVLTLVSLAAIATASDQAPDKPAYLSRPSELGDVNWLRDFDEAVQKSKTTCTPLLILFQEVPGCSTCVNYGEQVLSYPLIVEAAESLFIPVAVFNNIPGPDEKTLKSFKEKAWNNPVVRIVSPDRADLVPKVAGNYTVAGLAGAMVAALTKENRQAPKYLRLLSEEATARARGVERATFAMHCFWEGEGALGGIDGVVGTMPGFLDKLEVVEVEFDPEVVDYDMLVKKAQSAECAARVFTRSDGQHKTATKLVGRSAVRHDGRVRPDKQPKYYLSKSPLCHVPMTGIQACRVNAAVGSKSDARIYLSPRQSQLLSVIEKHPDAGWPDATGRDDLAAAWREAAAVAAKVRKQAS